MLTEKELGAAIASAFEKKAAIGAVKTKVEMAKHFRISPPSLQDWIKRGTISKDKLPELWRYFSDVADYRHWGMSEEEWPKGLSLSSNSQGKTDEGQSPEDNKGMQMANVVQFREKSSKKITDEAVFEVLDVHAACGAGYLNSDYPEVVRTIVMTTSEAFDKVGSINRHGEIKVIVAQGGSMSPTIKPGDLLFVDVTVKDYSGEGPYLIRHGGELLCKRLSVVGRTLTVSSDNSTSPSWPWSEKQDDSCIVGKVACVLPMNFTRF